MPGVELSTSACDGHVVVALRGDLDGTGAADAGAAIVALVIPGVSVLPCGVLPCGRSAGIRR
jgi:hypothetical protein